MNPEDRLKEIIIGLDSLVNQARETNAKTPIFNKIATTLRWLHKEIDPNTLESTLKHTFLENRDVIKALLLEPMFDESKYN